MRKIRFPVAIPIGRETDFQMSLVYTRLLEFPPASDFLFMKSLLPFIALTVAVATSCTNNVSLSRSDRALVSPTRVKNEVGLPEAIDYTDRGNTGVVAELQQNDRAAIHATLGERADRGAIILRDEFINSLRRSKVAKVSDSSQKSELTLTITKLGLLPSKRDRNKMQFKLEVQAILADLNGRVIWQANHGSHQHSDQLPIRHIDEYKSDNELLRKDFALTCHHVSDKLVADLRSQMKGDEEQR